MIEIKDVVKVYDTGSIQFKALHGINLSIAKGEFTSIMGPSGSGKTTLLHILGCLDKMTEGRYILNGSDVSNMKDDELARVRNKEIGFVFQAFNLLPRMTILENVELPMVYAGVPAAERRRKALAALEKVGLSDRVKHRPNEISGGQKQRVAIARAIVNTPSVIMADEPTGNLDTASTLEIMKIFQHLNEEGSTIVMVTHEPEVAQYTKRIVRFRDGNLVADENVQQKLLIEMAGE